MSEGLNICGTDLSVREYEGQRVVSLIDIDVIHQKRKGTAAQYFNQNKTKFVEGVDFFINTGYGKSGNCKLFTVSGYSLLTRQFVADKDNHIMREMLNQYFVPITERKDSNTDKAEDIFGFVNGVSSKAGISVFQNEDLGLQMRTILNDDGSISVNAEDTAIGFGWCREEMKNGKRYFSVRWATVNKYCKDLGFANNLAKDDYIPESLFYMLAMKANNDRAQRFQRWIAIDVIPAIRKTGTYSMEPEVEVKVTETMRNENCDNFLEAARIMASVHLESSQPYVVNCLRHVVSDIDAIVTPPTITDEPAEQTTEISVKTKQTPPYYKQGVPIDVEKLKMTMAVKHLSKEDIAAKMQVSVTSVNNWVCGVRKPLLENRIKLCVALGENENYLTPKRKRRTKE